MYLPSQPQQHGINQKEGVRGQVRGSSDLSVSAAQCHILGKGKQTVLACRHGGLSRVAWLGQGYRLGQDRKGWQASDKCCSLFLYPEKRLNTQRVETKQLISPHIVT